MNLNKIYLENTRVCEATKKRFHKSKMVKIINKITGKEFWLSPQPAFEYMQKALKDTEISKKQIEMTGLWREGARSIDIKSYLEQWNKKLLDK